MAAAAEKLHILTECPICLTSMVDRQPRALACLHTFCEKCLADYVGRKQVIICPVCRKRSNLPAGGVSGLPVNFLFNQLTSSLRQMDRCQKCDVTSREAKPASFLCRTCRWYMCTDCKLNHDSVPLFHDHNLLPLSPASQKEASKDMCSTHGESLNIYCPVCIECLCAMCAVLDKHKNHLSSLKYVQDEIDSQLNALCQLTDTLESSREEKSEVLKQLINDMENTERKITQEGDRRKGLIDKQVKELKEELTENYITPARELLQQVEESELKSQPNPNDTDFGKGQLQLIKHIIQKRRECKGILNGLENKFKEPLLSPKFFGCAEESRVGHLDITFQSAEEPGSSSEDIEAGMLQSGTSAGALCGAEQAALMKPGTSVKRGLDWEGRTQDGPPPGTGRVLQTHPGTVTVQWITGYICTYSMGRGGRYELQLAD